MPFSKRLEDLRAGLHDGYHAGWPCTSFARLRWRPVPNMPGPVRSKAYPNGFPHNSTFQQREADLRSVGTRSVLAREDDLLPPPVTFENAPESGHPEHLSAWELEAVRAVTKKPRFQTAVFNTRAYQPDQDPAALQAPGVSVHCLFGYKVAPLLLSRLAAQVAHLLQSCVELEGAHQCTSMTASGRCRAC